MRVTPSPRATSCARPVKTSAGLPLGWWAISTSSSDPQPVPSSPESRKVSHGHENVATISERPPQLGHAINVRAMPRGGNSEQNRTGERWQVRKASDLESGPRYACCAAREKGLGFLRQKRERGTACGSPSQAFVVNAMAASAGRCKRWGQGTCAARVFTANLTAPVQLPRSLCLVKVPSEVRTSSVTRPLSTGRERCPSAVRSARIQPAIQSLNPRDAIAFRGAEV